MVPPELLHTSGSGLIMYMFESLNYCVCVFENRNMTGHEQCTIASELL
jgi:hypothetical protein